MPVICKAWAGSSAGIIPSNLLHSLKAIKLSSSVVDKYLIPAQYDFTHIYFSKEDEGSTRAQNAKALLDKSQEIKGDVFFLGKNFTNKSSKELRKDFGIDFSLEFEKLKLNEWSKPVESTYGSHLIKLVGFLDGRIRELEEIKPRVLVDLELAR